MARFEAISLLGGAIFGQSRYAEAEPLLVQGYEGMKVREAKIPSESTLRLGEAMVQLIALSGAGASPTRHSPGNED